MPVFRVQHESGYEYVTLASSLEDAEEVAEDTATRLTALEVLAEIQQATYDFEDCLADELGLAMQQFSDTATDLKRRNPGAFAGDDPAGRLWDAVDAFLSGKWEG